MNKKNVFVSLLFIGLLVCAGVLGYMAVALMARADGLEGEVSDLEDENRLLQDQIEELTNNSTSNSTSVQNKTYSLCQCWGGEIAEYFNVTTFWMNITLQNNGTHLLATVKINDLRFDPWYDSCVGIGFNYPFNSTLSICSGWIYHWYIEPDTPYWARQKAFGCRYEGAMSFFSTIEMLIRISAHTVSHDYQTGFIYTIPIPLVGITTEMHIEYTCTVSVDLCLDKELIT